MAIAFMDRRGASNNRLSTATAWTYLCVGLIMTLGIPPLQQLIVHWSKVAFVYVVGGVTGSASLVVFRFVGYERVRITWRSVLYLVGGLCIGIGYYLANGAAQFEFRSEDPWVICAGFVNLTMVMPFYEELVVRKYLFGGLSKFAQPLLSAIIVSLLFGVAHPNMIWFAFAVSLWLCFVTYNGVGVVDRTLFHGAFNCVMPVLALISILRVR